VRSGTFESLTTSSFFFEGARGLLNRPVPFSIVAGGGNNMWLGVPTVLALSDPLTFVFTNWNCMLFQVVDGYQERININRPEQMKVYCSTTYEQWLCTIFSDISKMGTNFSECAVPNL
jgi:hypothetical protein